MSLRVLSMASNRLVGGIPNSLGSLTNLVSVDLSNNSFSGAIPFRPMNQRKLHQMCFYGNDDLIAPDRWSRHETPRFRMEHTPARFNHTHVASPKKAGDDTLEPNSPKARTLPQLSLHRSTIKRRSRLPTSRSLENRTRSELLQIPSWTQLVRASHLIPTEKDCFSNEWPLSPQGFYKDEEALLLEELQQL